MVDREEVKKALNGEPVSLVRERQITYAKPTHAFLSFGTGSLVYYSQPIVWKFKVLGAIVVSFPILIPIAL